MQTRINQRKKLTPEEVDIVAEELGERVRDLVYATAFGEMKKSLASFNFKGTETCTPFIVTYECRMCVGDIFQVLARREREKRGLKLGET